jgi:hypothetical protein
VTLPDRGGDTANRSDRIHVTVAGDACTGLGQQAGPAGATGWMMRSTA